MDKKKILIVDDERDALFILEKTLAARGYSVITADNGNDSIVLAKSKHPDLIILDIAMPDIDGGEVSGRLKKDPKTKDIPIIFLTALVSKIEEKKKDHVLAGNVLIAKPYDIEELLTQVEMLLSEEKVCPVGKAEKIARKIVNVAKNYIELEKGGVKVGIQNWSEDIVLVKLPPEPQIADELKAVTEVVRDRGDCDVVVDFSRVDIVTSSSLSKLLKLRKLSADCGRRFVLCSVAPATKGIFTVTGLDGIFELVDDKSAALASLQMVG